MIPSALELEYCELCVEIGATLALESHTVFVFVFLFSDPVLATFEQWLVTLLGPIPSVDIPRIMQDLFSRQHTGVDNSFVGGLSFANIILCHEKI